MLYIQRLSNIAFLYVLEVLLPCGKKVIKLDDFCSLRFDMISMNEAMPSNVTVNLMDYLLQNTMTTLVRSTF